MKLAALALTALVVMGAVVVSQETATRGAVDSRVGALRDLDGHFPFVPSASRADWESRATALRRQVRVALGLWPWPTRTPLNAVVHGAVSRDGYTVERAFFESVPGHYVTGSLYRPSSALRATEGRPVRRPAVLSPHGHWPGGRFQDVPEAERRKQLASGAERFDNGARHLLQARAVQLARMGTVVFLYDMIGYADSVQIPQDVAHSPRGRTRADAAGLFFSLDAELNLNSILGLQIWNGIRALDFLTSLPDVDPTRIAITGASGGGTQTFLISALDDRPAVAFPAVMVSTRMQGGCTCENADYLRIGTGNVELAALFAPKPLGMTAADDWTKTMPADGYPELQAHYALYGAKDKVALFPFLQFGHNYNHVSRTAMYGWLNTHLKLGLEDPVLEQDFVPLTQAEATVWDDAHPAPAAGEAHERAVTRWWREDSARQLAWPRDPSALAAWRDAVGGAAKAIVDAPRTNLVISPPLNDGRDRSRARGIVVVASSGAESMPNRGVDAVAAALRGAGLMVEVVDGARHGLPTTNRLVANRTSAAYTFGYNVPVIVERAGRLVTKLVRARTARLPVTLMALDGPSSAWAALAAASAPELVDRLVFVTDGFRFASATSMEGAAFLPGAAKYGDLPGLLALSTPRPLWVAGENADTVKRLTEIYRVAGAPKALTVSKAADVNAIVKWIMKSP